MVNWRFRKQVLHDLRNYMHNFLCEIVIQQNIGSMKIVCYLMGYINNFDMKLSLTNIQSDINNLKIIDLFFYEFMWCFLCLLLSMMSFLKSIYQSNIIDILFCSRFKCESKKNSQVLIQFSHNCCCYGALSFTLIYICICGMNTNVHGKIWLINKIIVFQSWVLNSHLITLFQNDFGVADFFSILEVWNSMKRNSNSFWGSFIKSHLKIVSIHERKTNTQCIETIIESVDFCMSFQII